jgi:hypothetical protein
MLERFRPTLEHRPGDVKVIIEFQS